MIVSLIVAADEKQGIGYKNQLLCYLPNDLKYFKRITSGHPVIMGRKTYESIGRPLPNRKNLVLTGTVKSIEGCTVAGSLHEALQSEEIKDAAEVFIIGGDSVYKQAIDLANKVYLTRIHHSFEADAWFPVLPASAWKLTEATQAAADEKNAYAHTFEVYERITE